MTYIMNRTIHSKFQLGIYNFKTYSFTLLTLFEVALCGEPSLDKPGIFSKEIRKGQKEFCMVRFECGAKQQFGKRK